MAFHYDKHCDNLRLIEHSIKSVNYTLLKSIDKEKHLDVEIYTKILSSLVNSWTEARIMKLINEENAFTDSEIKRIIGKRKNKQNSLEQKWKETLQIAYNKSFQGASNNPDNQAKLDSLKRIISSHLRYSAAIRNKLAHGQWKHAFNKNLLDINSDLTKRVNDDNYTRINLRYDIFKVLSQIIHDLAVSTPTFERDFEKNYHRIEQRQQYIPEVNKKYDKFVENRVAKEQNSMQIKQLQTKPPK